MLYPIPVLQEPGLRQLFAAIVAAGGEARLVGGIVRDYLLGRALGDADLACTLLPQAMLDLARKLGVQAIPTGIAHGTVTLLLPQRAVEITTLRRDVATDGRHAQVAFTDDFAADAQRRDFTVNALYLDARGALFDPTGGLADLAAKRLRFIGDPGQRITEDHLRILRYFRLQAVLGFTGDAQAEAAITRLAPGLEALSGERIRSEMVRLLAVSPLPLDLLATMQSLGLPRLLGGPDWQPGGASASPWLEARGTPDAALPWARLLSLMMPAEWPQAAQMLAARWKLSRRERELLHYLARADAGVITEAAVKLALGQHPREWVEARLRLAMVRAGTRQGEGEALLRLAADWQPREFPLRAQDLLDLGYRPGPALGAALAQLQMQWQQSDYQLSATALRALIPPPR